MANPNSPNGFIPVSKMGSVFIPHARPYKLTTSAKICQGDPVILNASAGGYVTVGAAASGVIHVGICAASVYDSSALGTLDVLVYDDPQIIYSVQIATTKTATAAVALLATANMITYAAGSLISTGTGGAYYQSVMALDTPQVAAVQDFFILGLDPTPGNAWGDSARVLVMFSKHFRLGTNTNKGQGQV